VSNLDTMYGCNKPKPVDNKNNMLPPTPTTNYNENKVINLVS